MSQDRPLLGIALMLCFCVIAPLGDAVAKLIGESVALGPVLFIRFAVQLLLLSPFIFLAARPLRLSRKAGWACLLRTVLHIAAIGLMFTALRYMPLADAIAIVFVLPFINLVLGWLWLGETVGIRRIVACGVGFAGTVLVIQPSFAALGAVALLPLGAALAFSLFMLITRQVSAELDPIGLQYVSGLMATALLLPALMLGPVATLTELTWSPLSSREWALVLSLGVLGTLGHLAMTWSLRHAPSATVAPMQYIEIPVAAVIGLLIFSEWPNGMASLGIFLSMAAGLYVIIYEEVSRRRLNAAQATEQPPEEPCTTSQEPQPAQ